MTPVPSDRATERGAANTPTCTAPRIPELLLNLCLPTGEGYAVTGDLNEEYETLVRPAVGRIRGDIWYWKQAIRSVAPSLGRKFRRAPTPPRRETHNNRHSPMIERLWQDLRFAIRTLVKQPGFSAVIVLTLALGIGANTAIFSVLNPFLLRPLPFEDASQLVHIFGTDRSYEGFGWDMARISHADFVDMKNEAEAFEQLGAYTYGGVNISGGDEPRGVTVGLVTGDMFQILGVTAAIGRGITPEDAVAGSERVVVLGDGLWRANFGADPSVVGRTVLLDKTAHTVIGVMPQEFNFPFGGVRLWQPIVLDPTGQARNSRGLMGVGRLRPGATREAAQNELATIASRLTAEYPETNEHQGVNVVSLRKGLIFFFDILRIGLAALAMAVGLVLLIACINVANLMLARGMSRGREVAVRAAMGAGRMRIVAQLLTENAVLAVLAGALGVGLAVVAVRPLAGAIPDDLWRSGPVAIDALTLGFALTVSLATTIIIGLVPALRTTDTDLTIALKDGGRSASGSNKTRRLSSALVVGQLAGALVLLTGATLLIKSVRAMQNLDTGFVADPVLTSHVLLSRGNYEDAASLRVFYRDLFENLGGAPGVVAAAAVYPLPFNFETAARGFSIPGREVSEIGKPIGASAHWVTPGYFSAMQTTMLSGRDFTQQDDDTAPHVVIVNATMAQRYWPGEEAVGQTIVLEEKDRPTATVIGVVADMMGGGLYQESGPQIFASMYQEARRGIFLVARADGAPENLVSTLRAEIRGVDPNLPIGSIRVMNEVLNETMGPFRGVASLLLILAAGALVLASSGIYSVISYSVSQRLHEFGVRAALGASRRSVVRLVLRQGAILAVIGGAIGLGVAFGASKVASGFLFGIGAFDPVTFVVLPVFLVGVALVATYIPALRATRVDPMQALRYE